MDIVATFAPERLCYLAGDPYWVRPMTIGGFAVVIAWLDDVLPGRADRAMPPQLGSPEAQAALESRHGFVLLTWLALRDQGIGYPAAADVAMRASKDEEGRLIDVLFARRRSLDRTRPGGEDLSSAWWGPGMTTLSERVMTTIRAIGGLTLDQIDCYATEGAPDEKPGRLTTEMVQAMWEANRAKATGDATEVPE